MPELTRRTFINLAVLSTAAAVVSGCGESHEQLTGQYGGTDSKGIPYVNQPPGLTDGVPQYFATTCGMCPAGCGLFVRTMGGRAIKIEGNPEHPVNRGKTCARGQAALQQLYNPGRLRRPIGRADTSQSFSEMTWDIALAKMRSELSGSRGKTAIVVDAETYGRSPFAMETLQDFATAVDASLMQYSLLDDSPWRAACREVYGRDQLPDYRLDEADVIVAFSANFLEAWPSPVRAATLFGEFRQGARRNAGDHGYFVYIGPRMSMTAAKADLWLPCEAGNEGNVASSLMDALAHLGPMAGKCDIPEARINDLANKIRAAGSRAVAVAGDGLLGYGTALGDFTLVESINHFVGSRCVRFGNAVLKSPLNSGFASIDSLISDLNSGRVSTVLFVGSSNPIFTIPSWLGLRDALGKAKFVAAMSPIHDETSERAHLVMPTRSFLEDWGDQVPLVAPSDSDGVSICQPIIDPQFIQASGYGGRSEPWMDTRPLFDILNSIAPAPASVGGQENSLRSRIGRSGNLPGTGELPDAVWQSLLSGGGGWKHHDPLPVHKYTPFKISLGSRLVHVAGTTPEGNFTLLPYPHIYWYDGRHANCTWLQELPDPMSAAVWNSWIEINLQVAEKMGIRTGDIVRITSHSGYIDAPALPSPAIHPQAVAMPIGQGHTAASFGEATNRGVNPLAILDPSQTGSGSLAFNDTQVRLEKVRSAASGYDRSLNTLVLVQDRPNGQEPEAVQNLIHETASEAKRDRNRPVSSKSDADSPSLGKRS